MSCNAKFNKAGQGGTLSRPDRLNIIYGVFLNRRDQDVALTERSFEIATKFAYQNGRLIGAPRDGNKECQTVAMAPVLPAGYVRSASWIAHRRMMLAGYHLADLLTRLLGN